MITNSMGGKAVAASHGKKHIRPEHGEAKDGSVDIIYEKLLDDLKQYCSEREIEEKCREYAEKKKAEKRQGDVTQSTEYPINRGKRCGRGDAV